MITFVIIGIVLFVILRKLALSLEYSIIEYSNYERKEVWHDVKLPLWAWILIALFMCLPVAGIFLFICACIGVIVNIVLGSFRFKKGKGVFLTRLIDILSKKY